MYDVFCLPSIQFPESFLWGSTTAGHQIEGGNIHSQAWHNEQQPDCITASRILALNEPRWDIPAGILKHFTKAACQRVRCHCPPEKVTFVFHDGFRSFREYAGFLQEPEFRNVAIDIHRYQCFDRGEIDMDIFSHIKKSAVD